MNDLPMTPDEARALIALIEADSDAQLGRESALDALQTIAGMRVEHTRGPVDWEKVDGRYEVYHRTRLVSEWRDAGQ